MKNSFIEYKIKINDTELHYYRSGQGAPLLYLPGGGLGAMAHGSILELLSQHYDVIAVDLPGFGQSSSPQKVWSLEDYALIISKFLDSLEIKEMFLSGISLGGGIALCLAKNSQIIKKMVIIDSAGITGKQSTIAFRYNFYFKKPLYDIFLNRNFVGQIKAVKEFFINKWGRSKDWNVIIKTLEKCLFEKLTELDKITIPVLILWGHRDELFPVQNAEDLVKQLPNAQTVIIRGNHSWPVAKPKECFEHLHQWFK